ncbi:hypothetical protein [Pinibacter aurantiacus]|uniref:Uncharacterized protein n=1 Tax=Pinibacter aurantiacus TaxID=2851599 RepID=A0A9E2SDX5_9BACT|nr:hypothetical protein [Pinibacter aurantiacus]MBV4358165.1 hypothetical protein [Pinibacter aurantiacus]
MNILNLNHESLQQILPRIQKSYPDAILKKPFVGLETIQVQYENVLYVIRKRSTDFVIDFDLSESRSKLMCVVFGAVGVFIARFFFKSKHKAKIQQFNNSFIDIVNGIRKG